MQSFTCELPISLGGGGGDKMRLTEQVNRMLLTSNTKGECAGLQAEKDGAYDLETRRSAANEGLTPPARCYQVIA